MLPSNTQWHIMTLLMYNDSKNQPAIVRLADSFPSVSVDGNVYVLLSGCAGDWLLSWRRTGFFLLPEDDLRCVSSACSPAEWVRRRLSGRSGVETAGCFINVCARSTLNIPVNQSTKHATKTDYLVAKARRMMLTIRTKYWIQWSICNMSISKGPIFVLKQHMNKVYSLSFRSKLEQTAAVIE